MHSDRGQLHKRQRDRGAIVRGAGLIAALVLLGGCTVQLSPNDDVIRRLGVVEGDLRTLAEQGDASARQWAAKNFEEIESRLKALEAPPESKEDAK